MDGDPRTHRGSTTSKTASPKTGEDKKAVATAPKPEAATPVPRKSIVEAEDVTMQSVLNHWDEILKIVNPPYVRMSLKDATISSADASAIHLTFASASHRDKIADTKASRTVEDALLSVFKNPIRITCSLEKPAAAVPFGPATDLVEAVEEVFGTT